MDKLASDTESRIRDVGIANDRDLRELELADVSGLQDAGTPAES